MPMGLLILWLVLAAASVLLLVYWGVGLGRLVRTRRQIPTARAGVEMAARRRPAGRVCIIIPAHNEEQAIGRLVASLRGQDYGDLAVVLCLDRCSDGTAAAARGAIGEDGRFRLLEIESCPEGWAGKVNAAWTGARSAEAREAEYVLFADADTDFDSRCVSATVALMEQRWLDMLSLLSTLSTGSWFEKLVQPAAGLELVRQYPIARANRLHRRRAFANGQFMLFRRAAYDAIGGHEAVHDELLEDIALARRMADAERPAGLFLADGMVRCRMYDSWPAFRAGWKRIYTEAARCKVKRLREAAVAVLAMGAVAPVLAVVHLAWSLVLLGGEERVLGAVGVVISIGGLGVWAVVVMAVYRMGRAPVAAAPGFVVGSLLVALILLEAARDLRARRPVSWGGRSYVRVPRD